MEEGPIDCTISLDLLTILNLKISKWLVTSDFRVEWGDTKVLHGQAGVLGIND